MLAWIKSHKALIAALLGAGILVCNGQYTEAFAAAFAALSGGIKAVDKATS